MSGPLREELMSDKHRIRLETWPRVICLLPPPPPPHGFSIRECRQEPSGGWSGDATSLETFVHIVSEFDICEDGDRSNIRPHRPGGAGAKSRTRRREPAELGSLFCFYHLKETKFWDPISCNYLRLEFPETGSISAVFPKLFPENRPRLQQFQRPGRGFPANLHPCLPCSGSTRPSRSGNSVKFAAD